MYRDGVVRYSVVLNSDACEEARRSAVALSALECSLNLRLPLTVRSPLVLAAPRMLKSGDCEIARENVPFQCWCEVLH